MSELHRTNPRDYTVLLMLPDYERNNLASEKDWVREVKVTDFGIRLAVKAAHIQISAETGLSVKFVAELYSTIAVYMGHVSNLSDIL